MSSLEARRTDRTDLPLPTADDWEYGGYPYGIEPLTLPLASSSSPAARRPAVGSPPPWPDTWRGPSSEFPANAAVDLTDPLGVDRLFWFRWITGHQVTFVLWQLLASTLAESTATPLGEPRVAERARRYVRGYSLMLLYTSSCPRSVYDRLIRPHLALQHRHLSGAWARDFHPVRSLLRGRLPAGLDDPALREECLLNQHIHEGIAAKLVPSGVSLLQQAAQHEEHRLLHRDRLSSLYDCVFLTVRAPASYEQVVTQLVRRLHAIGQDLGANGLHPAYAPSGHEEPDELLTPDVARCKETLLPDLSRISDSATAAAS
ncbi:L-tyrosine 3-hydroxylase [Streptomyces bacillaris]|uniref:L-tyrosine 3-hydroxylase n=1 Tax=Streptomyces bacillaris TaxID=68179 RepID=UPI0037FA4CD6